MHCAVHDPCFLAQCPCCTAVCPPGFGRIAEEDLPDWWSGRRLLLSAEPGTNITSRDYNSNSNSNSTSLISSNVTAAEDILQEECQEVVTLGLTPPPPWATDCLPCPANFYSPGGAIGFAQCKICPDGWTTGNATASADCLGEGMDCSLLSAEPHLRTATNNTFNLLRNMHACMWPQHMPQRWHDPTHSSDMLRT